MGPIGLWRSRFHKHRVVVHIYPSNFVVATQQVVKLVDPLVEHPFQPLEGLHKDLMVAQFIRTWVVVMVIHNQLDYHKHQVACFAVVVPDCRRHRRSD